MKNSRPSDVNEAINQALEVADQATGTAPVIDSPIVGPSGVSNPSLPVGAPEFQSSTYHTSRGGNSNGLHVTQGSAPESDRHSAIFGLDGEQKRNGCVAQMDMPRNDAAEPSDVSSASPEFPLESLAKYSDEGENGWNAWGRADIAKKMQRIAAGGYNSVDKLIELVEVGR